MKERERILLRGALAALIAAKRGLFTEVVLDRFIALLRRQLEHHDPAWLHTIDDELAIDSTRDNPVLTTLLLNAVDEVYVAASPNQTDAWARAEVPA